MNIVYNENPLCTRVELDVHEAKNFWNLIKMAEMEELLFDAHFHMQDDRWNDMEAARRAVDPDYYMNEEDDKPTKLDQRVQVLYDYYMTDLLSSHGGDCTCFPASCSKCHAENMLGVDTISGLGKHSGNYVFAMFRGEEPKTCAQVIATMQANDKLSDTGKNALAWLINYQATKLTPTISATTVNPTTTTTEA